METKANNKNHEEIDKRGNQAPSQKASKKQEVHSDPIITLSRVFKIYKQGDLEVMALNDVNLQIHQGEIVLVMGPSGSGKTTLINCMCGLDLPSAGSIKFQGLEVTKLKDVQLKLLLREHYGIVFQKNNLIPTLTAEGNIDFPLLLTKQPKNYRKQRVTELLAQVGLENRRKHRLFALSGGEAQRIAIAMALANNPDILVADEPTGNVDSISTDKIIEIFHTLIQNHPEKAIIIVSHNPIFRKIANRTLILRDGKIIRELLPPLEPNNWEITTEDSLSDKAFVKKITEDTSTRAEDEVHRILDPKNRPPSFDATQECPNCNSTNITKKYDDKTTRVENNELLATGVIVCKDCGHIQQLEFAIYEIKKI